MLHNFAEIEGLVTELMVSYSTMIALKDFQDACLEGKALPDDTTAFGAFYC